MRCSASRASTPTGSIFAHRLLERFVDQLAAALRAHALGGLALVRGRAHLRQRAAFARADRRRNCARSRRTRRDRARLAAWLGDECGLADDILRLPGNEGRHRDEPAPGLGDEQPLDASAFVEAELAAFVVTGDPEHGARAQRAFEWFLGRNRLGRPLYDFATGGCCDGLGDVDVNANEGAESTLAFHRAQLVLDAAGLRSSYAVRRRRRIRRVAGASALRGRIMSTKPELAARELFRRHPGNPILSAEEWPYPANAVFNPAAALVDGETVLLARVEELTGISHLTVARSANGVDGWSVDAEPLLAPTTGVESEQWGFEDARTVWVDELDRWVITCTSYGPAGPAVFLAITEDFRSVKRLGIVVAPEDKNAALLPERINGKWVLFHRPKTEFGGGRGEIVLSRSHDLRSWSPPEVVLQPRDGAWWDSLRIGIGPPLLKTEHGWLLIYHGVKEMVGGAIYRVGLALLDLDEPTRVLHRLPGLGARPQRAVRADRRRPERRLPVRPRPRRASTRCGSTTAPPTRRSASRLRSSGRSRGGHRRATTGRGSASPG